MTYFLIFATAFSTSSNIGEEMVAFKIFDASNESYLSLQVGDKIELLSQPEDGQGWSYGKSKRTNRIGWFPPLFVIPSISALRIISNWEPTPDLGEEYIPLRKDDLILQLPPPEKDQGWAYGQLNTGRKGWFPPDFTEPFSKQPSGANFFLEEENIKKADDCYDRRLMKRYFNAWHGSRAYNDLQRKSSDQVKLGHSLQKKGNIDGAIIAYENAIKINDNNENAYFHLGVALEKKKDLGGAIKAYKKAVRIQPSTFAVAYTNLGKLLYKKCDFDGAINALGKSVEIHHRGAEAYFYLSLALEKKNDLDGAIKALENAVTIDTGFGGAYSKLGSLLYKKGDFDGVINVYGALLRINRLDADAITSFAFAEKLEKKNDLDGAITAFASALGAKQSDVRAKANAYFNIALRLEKKGDLGGAIEAYERTLKIDRNFAGVNKNLIRAARAAERGSRWL